MKKFHLLFLIIYIFLPNYSGAFIDLKKYAACEVDLDFANWYNNGKPLKKLSFKFIAYDKEFFYWDYDQEEEIFREKNYYEGKKFLKSGRFIVSEGYSYWIKFNKIDGSIQVLAPSEKNIIYSGNCEKTTKSKINKTKFN